MISFLKLEDEDHSFGVIYQPKKSRHVSCMYDYAAMCFTFWSLWEAIMLGISSAVNVKIVLLIGACEICSKIFFLGWKVYNI